MGRGRTREGRDEGKKRGWGKGKRKQSECLEDGSEGKG